jgi:hypothetical protein
MQFFIDNWYLSGIIITAVVLFVVWLILLIIEGIDTLFDTPEPLDDFVGALVCWVFFSVAWPLAVCVAIGLGAVLLSKEDREA